MGCVRNAKTLLLDAADQVLSPVGVIQPWLWSFAQVRPKLMDCLYSLASGIGPA